MNKIINDDCLESLFWILDDSIDSLITDPPAGISFMGKEWDMGSGSTGIAAKECGFDFIGIEKEKEYFEIAKKRINAKPE